MKKVKILGIVMLLLFPLTILAEVQYATVFSTIDGTRKVVEVGDTTAFNNGFILEVAQVKTRDENQLGFSVVTDYATTLSSSINSTQTTIPVSSVVTKDGHTLTMGDLGSKVFLVVEPGARKEEIIMCTGISSSNWTGCTRGLAFYGTSTASVSANRKTHSSGSTVIISNTHYVYDELVDKDAAETIAGVKTFTSSPIAPSPTTASQVAIKSYVDSVAQQGGATSTESIVGISQLATQTEMASTTFDTDNPAVLSTKYSTSSPDIRGSYAVISEADGYLDQDWLDLSEDFSFSGTTTMATTTINNLTVTGTTTLQELTIQGTSTASLINGSDANDLHIHNNLITGLSPSFDWFTYQIPFASWDSLDAGTRDSSFLYEDNTSNISSYIYLFGNTYNSAATFSTVQDLRVQMPITADVTTGDASEFGLSGESTPELSTTKKSIYFEFSAGDVLKAISSDGTSNESTTISGISINNINMYEIRWENNDTAKFYVNGVLKATHTTTVPGASSELTLMAVQIGGVAVAYSKLGIPTISLKFN